MTNSQLICDDIEYGTFFDTGGHLVRREGLDKPRLVQFPVCLAIKHGDAVEALCPDFVLNIHESWVFVKMASLLPESSPVLLHFYIPSEKKLLAEIQGIVARACRKDARRMEGMLIEFAVVSHQVIENLEAYIDGRKPLVDELA